MNYELFNRTFEGLDLRFLAPIKERFPADYERILEWFPWRTWRCFVPGSNEDLPSQLSAQAAPSDQQSNDDLPPPGSGAAGGRNSGT